MRLNTATQAVTHEGGRAVRSSPINELRRAVSACLLWEDSFYESGVAIADRIKNLVSQCSAIDVAELAVKARQEHHLRHVPLLLARELARNGTLQAGLLPQIIQRADELAEFLALYWKEGKQPLSKSVKRGLASAFTKFDEYQLAKYDRANAIRLRDVLFLCHAKPISAEQAALWGRLVNNELKTPDTWEVALSGGADKKEAFTRLLQEKKLGYMALLRNLRNMYTAGVDESLVFEALQSGAARSKALPFRYVAAARAVPAWKAQIDIAMQAALSTADRLPGKTVVLVDVSGSMDDKLSKKSDLTRVDSAAALAVLINSIADTRVFTFSNKLVEVAPCAGMALIDAIKRSQMHSFTVLRRSLESLRDKVADCDRLIVITDEQSNDGCGAPIGKGYMINVASYQNGVGYGRWVSINGFSESVVAYIQSLECQPDPEPKV